MNTELFPELVAPAGVRFVGTPDYTEVVNAIAALEPKQLADLVVHFTRTQWHALNLELDSMLGVTPVPRTKVCGFPVQVMR